MNCLLLPCLLHKQKVRLSLRDAHELKVKETNRIDTVVNELKKLGATIAATEDGMIIHGKNKLGWWCCF